MGLGGAVGGISYEVTTLRTSCRRARSSYCGHCHPGRWPAFLHGKPHGDRGRGHLTSGVHVHRVPLTLSWKAVMSHSSTSRLEPRFSAPMNCSRFSCLMPGVLKISRSLCHDCLS